MRQARKRRHRRAGQAHAAERTERNLLEQEIQDDVDAQSGGVFVDGARWQGISDSAIAQGDAIEVVEVQRKPMRLRVKRAGS